MTQMYVDEYDGYYFDYLAGFRPWMRPDYGQLFMAGYLRVGSTDMLLCRSMTTPYKHDGSSVPIGYAVNAFIASRHAYLAKQVHITDPTLAMVAADIDKDPSDSAGAFNIQPWGTTNHVKYASNRHNFDVNQLKVDGHVETWKNPVGDWPAPNTNRKFWNIK